MDWLLAFPTAFWSFLVAAAPLMLVGFALAGALKALLPEKKIARWIGGRGHGAVVRAAIAGAPMPLCSCGVIPVAASLKKQGASNGATISFLISAPETGVDSIAASAAILDPVMTIVRPFAAVATALVAGFAENLFGQSDAPATAPEPAKPAAMAAASGCGCCSSKPAPAPATTGHEGHEHGANSAEPAGPCCGSAKPGAGKFAIGARYAFVEMFDDLAVALLVGFLLAGAVGAAFPGDVATTIANGARFGGWGPWAEMLAMLALGVPVYVCATAATPLAAALIAGGVSPGAALVFLLAGPATNLASLALIGKMVGRRGLAIHLSSIAVCALAMGFALNGLYGVFGVDARRHVAATAAACLDCDGAAWWIGHGSAALLLGLCLAALSRRISRSMAKPAAAAKPAASEA